MGRVPRARSPRACRLPAPRPHGGVLINHWRPFWGTVDGAQRAQYLDHWKASPEWLEAVEFHFSDDPALDAADDVRESDEYVARHREERAARLGREPWWARWFKSRE